MRIMWLGFFLFVLLTIVEAYICMQFHKKQLRVYLKSALTSYGALCLYLIASYFLHIAVPNYMLILVMVTIFAHTFLGHYLGFYSKSIAFDRCLHGFGTFSCALFLFTVLINLTEAGGSKFFRAVFVAALGIAAGAIFELLEYAADKKQHTKSQKGLMDTDTDSLANMIGAVCAAVFAWFAFL